ncbi:wall-associated receptor kinase-like 2 [Lactuca sativa]|nr:wall-associated receptor kinase-like 2 [Lactuca sativa]
MKLFQAYHLLIFLLLKTTSARDPKYTKPGCQVMCGDVRIPYPFGIGVNCSVSEWYNVDCNRSTPYLPAVNNVQVLKVDLEYQTVKVNVSMIFDCHNRVRTSSQILGIELGESNPFLFSRIHNQFVVEGCGNAVIMDHGITVAGCSTTCSNEGTVGEKDTCLGITCCQTRLPYYLKTYSMDLTRLERQGGDGACGSAFLVDNDSYDEVRLSGDSTFIPISLMWILSERESSQIKCCNSGIKIKVDTGNGTSTTSSKCIFPIYVYEGNPYLSDGCDVPPQATEECAECINTGGLCEYHKVYDDYDRISEYAFSCSPNGHPTLSRPRRLSLGAILGPSISIGVAFLLAISYASYKVINEAIARRRRMRYFKRNGGQLLEQQEKSDPSSVGKTMLFSLRELEKATDCFSEKRILGVGGQGTVYKGMLLDGRTVAVKKSERVVESQQEKLINNQFINEVVILSQVIHPNVVKLLGCCLETKVPLLVSEFVSNGTLYDRIHKEANEFPLSLKMRIQIATEVARALAHLHSGSGTSIPIYHRDVKTSNILLDDNNIAKISDFGTSRNISPDETHLTTMVIGTVGYLDPEYLQTEHFNEKCDVYSFGVVLVELLTGEKPIFQTTSGQKTQLAAHFISAMEEGCVISIFDKMVINEGTTDELLALANLAMRCLCIKGKDRPTMMEVEHELESIRTSHVPSRVEANIDHVMGKGKQVLTMPTTAESSSTPFKSFNEPSTSQ